jgi:hypothetical protein
MALRDPAKCLVWVEGDLAGREGCDAMVHSLQNEAMQVDEVAGDVKGRDLAFAVGQDLVATGETFQDEAALGWAVTVAHEVLIRADVPGVGHGLGEDPRLLVREGVALLKLADERIDHGSDAGAST